MPRTFNPGHRPSQPLYPDALAYSTVAKVVQYLQLPATEPVALGGDTSISGNNIRIPITGADYRRWGFVSGDTIKVYDDLNAKGIDYILNGTQSAGSSGLVWLLAPESQNNSFTTANNAFVQPASILTDSNERGITKSGVENLIKKRQDYIDTITRMAWRPRIVVDEYKNFTTFKPYRRRYYTDYVGAVYLNHRSIRQILKMGVWQGDFYRELAAGRMEIHVDKTHKMSDTDKIFLCPNVAHVGTLQAAQSTASSTTKWIRDFGKKSVADEIASLINEDSDTSKAAIQIGSLTQNGSNLNISNEYLATGNSDEGDGVVVISSMREAVDGTNSTVAVSQRNSFLFDKGNEIAVDLLTETGTPTTSFTTSDAAGMVQGSGLYYIEGLNGVNHVALCSRDDNTITITTDLTSSFASNVGGLSDIIVDSGGSGYTSAPSVSISGGTGVNAAATATVTNGAITKLTISNPGSAYLSTDTNITVSFSGGGGSGSSATAVVGKIKQYRFKTDIIDEERQKDWWSIEDNGAILFNNQYPFFENHSLKVSYIYGERYLDKVIEDVCTKLVVRDILMSDDYTSLFPEGTQNVSLDAKIQKLDEETKRLLIPYQETIIVAGVGG
jgi:hypothetical protein